MIKIGSENGPPAADPTALAGPLRELAEQAADHGTRVAIETMPFSAIATVPMGAEIVSAAGHPAAGLLVDAWHVFRADTTLAELRDCLTPEMIFGVELDDAAAHVEGTLFEDTVENRLLCGEGTFDLVGLIATLRELGFDGPWGCRDPRGGIPDAAGGSGPQAGSGVGPGGAVVAPGAS